jgi:hypothetical protein
MKLERKMVQRVIARAVTFRNTAHNVRGDGGRQEQKIPAFFVETA